MIYLKNGMHFTTGERRTLGGSDLFLIYELWANESYYIPGNIDFKIHETDTVVDVGANRGYFSCFAAHKAEKGKVFSFEPMPENFTILKRNLELNNIHNIVAENMAVSSAKGTIDFYLFPGDDAANSVYPNGGQKTSVQAIDLPSYCLEKRIDRIDFLKIDCEGEEYRIFENLPDTFWSSVKRISMEYHIIDGHDPKELVKKLESKNFKVLTFDEKYIKAVSA
jgi:FkbM family methyltransferase